MATDQARHKKWADRQLAALLDLGIDLLDAQRSVQWVMDAMPEDADPDTWIPTPEHLDRDPASAEAVQDARAAWYASDGVPGRFKRLLDARPEREDS